MLRCVFLEYVFKILNRFDFRIAKLLQHTQLNLETAGGVKNLLTDSDIGGNGVDCRVVIAVFHPVHVFAHDLLYIRSMFVDEIG
ncbi:hypothetical protein D3C77_724810 [compost metagenome]